MENWLVIYDNQLLPLVNHEEGVSLIRENMEVSFPADFEVYIHSSAAIIHLRAHRHEIMFDPDFLGRELLVARGEIIDN